MVTKAEEEAKKGGRPKKPFGEKKLKRLIYLTDNEYSNAKRKSERFDLSFSEFAMSSMLGKEVTVITPAYKELVIAINRVGVNVNQIAHFWNENAGSFSESDVLKSLRTIHELLSDIKTIATKKSVES